MAYNASCANRIVDVASPYHAFLLDGSRSLASTDYNLKVVRPYKAVVP
jgi:hypothetical protein